MKLMQYKHFGLFSLFAIVCFFLASCGSGKKEETDASAEFEKAEEDIDKQIKGVLVELPPPSEIPFLLEATGADYDESLVNDFDDLEKYKTSNNKAALNLGVYAADIGYLASHKKVQEALNYMTKAKELADEIGVSNSFDQQLIERFENNLSKSDSLGSILNEAISRSDEQLQDRGRRKSGALLLGGSFVEGLYLATALIENYPEDLLPEDSRNLILVPLIRIVLDQEKPLDNLIELLKTIEQDEQIKTVINHLEELASIYDGLDIDEKIQNNRGDLLVTDETLVKITNKVGDIRDFITS